MKFDERTSFALHWAIIIGMVVATCLIAVYGLTGCSTSTLVKDCAKVESQDFYKCKTLKPWE